MCKLLDDTHTLTAIDLSQNPISDKFAAQVLPSLRKNLSIVSLQVESIALPSAIPDNKAAALSLNKQIADVVDYFDILAANETLRLCRLRKASSLSLRNRGFSTLPRTITSLTHLTSLNLSRNEFVELPHELLNLSSLQVRDDYEEKMLIVTDGLERFQNI